MTSKPGLSGQCVGQWRGGIMQLRTFIVGMVSTHRKHAEVKKSDGRDCGEVSAMHKTKESFWHKSYMNRKQQAQGVYGSGRRCASGDETARHNPQGSSP